MKREKERSITYNVKVPNAPPNKEPRQRAVVVRLVLEDLCELEDVVLQVVVAHVLKHAHSVLADQSLGRGW